MKQNNKQIIVNNNKDKTNVKYPFGNFICKFFSVYIAVVFILLNTINLFYGHLFRPEISCYNLLFSFIAVIVPLAFISIYYFVIRQKYKKKNLALSKDKKSFSFPAETKDKETKALKKKTKYKKYIIIGVVILFLLQLLVLVGMAFISGWEVRQAAFGSSQDSYYFSIYPNNLFLRSIFFLTTQFLDVTGLGDCTLKLLTLIHPKASEITNYNFSNFQNGTTAFVAYMYIVLLNIVCTTVSVAMISRIVRRQTNITWGVISFVFAGIFVGLMPWILVPYSDMFGLFFCTTILYTYIFCKNKYIKPASIVFLTIIGFNIKPTVIFVFLAIIVIELYFCLKNGKLKLTNIKGDIKQILLQLLVIVCVACVTFGLVSVMKLSTGIQTDKNKEFGSLHFLMMGTNPDSQGIWNQSDVDISDSAANQEERSEYNIQKIKDNLQTMGPLGIVDLVYKKTMCNYDDGTFHWGREGRFSLVDLGVLKPVKDFYGHYAPLAQVLWFIVLLGCIFIFVRKKYSKETMIVCLTLLFLSGFLTVFECGSRYLILYLNYFIFASVLGWKEIVNIFSKKILKTVNDFYVH